MRGYNESAEHLRGLLSNSSEAVELRNEREETVWKRAEADAREFLRGVSVRQGYGARGVRVPSMSPTEAEELIFYQKAWTNIGPFTRSEEALYLRSFRNTCLEGYPHADS